MKNNVPLINHLVLDFVSHIAVHENQGKQHEFSDHWKLIKTLLLKKNYMGKPKEDKNTDWNTSFNIRF